MRSRVKITFDGELFWFDLGIARLEADTNDPVVGSVVTELKAFHENLCVEYGCSPSEMEVFKLVEI